MKADEKRILESLRRAAESETPDVLPDVLLRLQQMKGEVQGMEQNAVYQTDKAAISVQGGRWKTAARWAAGAAAALLLALGGQYAWGMLTPQAMVGLDVNPSIELRINSADKVLSASALNQDAETVLGDMDLKQVHVDVAVNALLGSMVKNGYIDEARNSVLISVDSRDSRKGEALLQRLSQEADSTLSSYQLEGAVLSQVLSGDSRLQALAEEYGISLSKAALVEQLVQADSTLLYSEAASLSVHDLNLLMEARKSRPQAVSVSGKAGSSGYISGDEALALAVERAGLSADAVEGQEVELDCDDGRMVYEVELRSGGMEYEVELDASDGSVLSYKAELKYKEQLTADCAFTLEQAKETALKDAGLTAGQVTLQKAVTYEEDGRPQHKVIFRTDTARYTYVMDGSTGEFLAAERKDFSGNAASSASSSVFQGSSFSAGSISADQARSIALEHAGVSGSDLTKYDSELDRHHNRQVYEIEFETGS
ncbi:MAG: PepSY domain-containing protein, partial [Oscillospiraceae bacterium]|nr:PepSY domain-containing protein [Oscillospiraceae bacterium]